jgi:hypothetical protein
MKQEENIVEKALAILNDKRERPKMGVTVADVLRVFPGAKVILPTTEDLTKPKSCKHCSDDHIPAWRRGGKIVEVRWTDGRVTRQCHFCGRAVKDPIVANDTRRGEQGRIAE